MGALAFIQLNQTLSPRLSVLDSPKRRRSGERRMLSILNWIAMFFVRDPRDDWVASALSIEDGRITLYLAANRGRPQDEDVKNGVEFMSALRRAFHNPKTAQLILFKSAIHITRYRLSRKFDMITDMRFPLHSNNPTLPIETFENLVTKWAEADGMEHNQDLIELAQTTPSFLLEGGINALKYVFKDIVIFTGFWSRRIASGEDGDDLLTAAGIICRMVCLLLYSDFFRKVVVKVPGDVKGIKPFDAEEYRWLQKLKRRLWRVARYWREAGTFAGTGMEWIKRILGDSGLTDGFRVVWVGLDADTLPEDHGVRYVFPGSPQDRFNALLGVYGFEDSSENKDPGLKTDLSNLWSEPNQGYSPTITPFLHCELQLISYLDQRGIPIQMNLIGTSKLMCWACNICVKEVNRRRTVEGKKPYVLCGTSGKAHQAWLIPPGQLHDFIVSSIRNALKDAISSLAMQFGHRRKHSGGSDSSTGSRDNGSLSETENE